ncbi:MAG TPA: UDP-N-acetylmuramoyl-tripeptide--D-alanyl-D-alanine ligase [Rhodanobacteraceae bacterium]|nr:UDP-N-acetylmuramoyl-tripeptide--D-alanyl-D-alanine ligase [Rhodanobacteraceae bacterium]
MLNLRLDEVALWTRGRQFGADAAINAVITDSRRVAPGALFVALQGEHVDGHDFVVAAAACGAAAALVSRRVESVLPQVLVDDVLLALGDLASSVRAQRRARVVGITGSSGKTTVKGLLAAILARRGVTHVTAGNYNNEIGLPLTLLAMPADAEYAVLEMGAGKPGDIAYLAAIARPQVALVTNIGAAHLERLGSVDGVASTKGALYEALPADGIAVINADDAYAGFFAGLAGTRRVLRFGLGSDTEVGVAELALAADGSRFRLLTPAGAAAVQLPLPGRHNVHNALAAAAVATALDIPLADIVAGLETANAVPGRLVRRVMPGGWTLIDDSYNANPGSVAAAIATLALAGGETWLVLGDMAELGAGAEALHAAVGAQARAAGIGRLFTVGRLSRAASAAFGSAGMHCHDQAALIAALRAALHAGVTCLVKGSRSSGMERVVAALSGDTAGGATHAA